MKGTGVQQRYFSELDEKDLNIRAGLTYKIYDGYGDLSNIQLGYMGRIVDDNFEATEYDMSVIKQSVFDIEHIALADYYNQENLKMVCSNSTVMWTNMVYRKTFIQRMQKPHISFPHTSLPMSD